MTHWPMSITESPSDTITGLRLTEAHSAFSSISMPVDWYADWLWDPGLESNALQLGGRPGNVSTPKPAHRGSCRHTELSTRSAPARLTGQGPQLGHCGGAQGIPEYQGAL